MFTMTSMKSDIYRKFKKLRHRKITPSSIDLTKELKLFDISAQKIACYNDNLCQKALCTSASFKTQVETIPQVPISDEEVLINLYQFAEKCPSTRMSRFVERDIRNLIQIKDLQEKYCDQLDIWFKEVKQEFLVVTHTSGVNLKVKHPSKSGRTDILPYKNVGRTPRYHIFVENRMQLQYKFMLHHKLVNGVVAKCVKLPKLLFSLQNAERQFTDIEVFQELLNDHMLTAKFTLQYLYDSVLLLVDQHERDSNLLGCCNGLLSIFMSRIIQDSMRHICEVSTSKKCMPLFNIYVSFMDQLCIHPTCQDIIDVYTKFVCNIAALSDDFVALDKYALSTCSGSSKRIFCGITDEFKQSCITEITLSITEIYSPVLAYAEKVNSNFEDIYEVLCGDLSRSDVIFKSGCADIVYYRKYMRSMDLVPQFEYFMVGKLDLCQFKDELKRRLNEISDNLFTSLRMQHQWENDDINECFEIITTKSNIQPQTTEQVIEIGKYMIWVKETYLNELHNRACASLASLTEIIRLGILSEEHIALNSTVINWLDRILPIVDVTLANFEQLKFEAEEKLQRIIEDVNVMTVKVHPILVLLDDMDSIVHAKTYLNTINKHMLKIEEIKKQIVWINTEETSLSFPKSSYPEFEELKNYVYPFYHLLKVSLDVQRNVCFWLDGQFDLLSHDETKQRVEFYCKELTQMQKNYRAKLRQAQDENIAMRFKGTIDDPDLLNWPTPLKICATTLKQVEDFKPCLSVMKIMCNPALELRHWKEMSVIIGVSIAPNAGSTLRKLMKIDLNPHIDKCEIISLAATKEKHLLSKLNEMDTQWEEVFFLQCEHATYGVTTITNVENIMECLDDQINELILITSLAFVQPHLDKVMILQKKLQTLEKVIIQFTQFQGHCLDLFPLFESAYICKNLPKEHESYQILQTQNVTIVAAFLKHSVIHVVEEPHILDTLEECHERFETIYNGVTTFLNVVRDNFSRFYFLNNMELVALLSNLNSVSGMHLYFSKCFPGIKNIIIENNELVGVTNTMDERLLFETSLPFDENALSLFNAIHNSISQALKQTFKSVMLQEEVLVEEMLSGSALSQVIVLRNQTLWTSLMHKALDGNGSNLIRDLNKQLDDYLTHLNSQLNNSHRTILRLIIIQYLHLITITRKIITEARTMPNDFEFLVQLRCYNENQTCLIRVFTTSIECGYELIESGLPLVILPQTERCYRILVNAFSLHMNGSIYGSASSGKSETFRELCKALQIFNVSLSCSDSVDYKTISRYLTGVCKSNAWLCIDDANQIRFEILSIMADKLNELKLIKVVETKTFFVCLTLNPNRVQLCDLPTNFKVLFRSASLPLPCLQTIAEVFLSASGFDKAKAAAVKISTAFTLLSGMFSNNTNLSIGTLKSILIKCDEKRRNNASAEEYCLVYNSIRELIGPMIKTNNVLIYNAILNDIFQEASVVHEGLQMDSKLMENINVTCETLKLEHDPVFLKNILSVNDIINNRRHIIVIGHICSGKTTLLKVLLHSLNISQKITSSVFNPNTMNFETLFGSVSSKFDLWNDGILTKTIRNTIERHWLIFDGPISPSWIEHINSMLDERPKLHLASGEVLNLAPNLNIIFEVHNLLHASPTTVMRCGIVHLERSSTPWVPYIKCWIRGCSTKWINGNEEIVKDLFNWIIPSCFNFIQKHCRELYSSNIVTMAKTLSNFVMFLLEEACHPDNIPDLRNISTWIQASFLQATAWTCVSTLTLEYRCTFDCFLKKLFKNQLPESPYPKTLERLEVSVPTEGLLYDYFYIYKGKGIWKYLPDLIKKEKTLPERDVFETFVPTLESVKIMTFLKKFVPKNLPCLLIGPKFSGKTHIVQAYFKQALNKDQFSISSINFCPRIRSRDIQEIVLSKLQKCNLMTSTSKTNLIYIDDLSMIPKNQHNVSEVTEILRQYFDYKFWYHHLKGIVSFSDDLHFIATMRLENALENNVCPRFLRHFYVFGVDSLCEDNLNKIYSTVLQNGWKNLNLSPDVAAMAPQIISGTLQVMRFCLKQFPYSPKYCTHIFKIRQLVQMVKSLMLISKDIFEGNKKIHLKLWMHETLRVFGDRLKTKSDTDVLFQHIILVLSDELGEAYEELFEISEENPECQKLVFSTILDSKYNEITNFEHLHESINALLAKYNQNNKLKLDIVIFEKNVFQLLKICRILFLENSNGLFLGLASCGRKCLTKLAASVYGNKVFKLETCADYSLDKWKTYLKNVLVESGGKGNSTVMLIEEDKALYEFILEDVNHLLRYGEIATLFTSAERQDILGMVRLDSQGGNHNIDISPDVVYDFFIERCRRKLHIIMCFDGVTKCLSNRFAMYPNFVDFAQVVWFKEWPPNAMTAIASTWLAETKLNEKSIESVTKGMQLFHAKSVQIYETVLADIRQKCYVTPCLYVEMIKTFITLFKLKQNEIVVDKNKYMTGLNKLICASNQISAMRESLAAYQPQLLLMSEKALEMTKEIAKETAEVEKISALVKADEKVANQQAAAAEILKVDCEADLAQAIPILEDAISALNTLKPSDITLVKSMKNPPDAIKLVMAAVCVIKDVKPDKIPDPSTGRKHIDYWGPSKRILGDMNFLQTLKDFDKDHIRPEIMVKIRKDYLPHKDFKPHTVAKASSAAEGLCKWIIAMDMYDKVAKEVAPKKEKLERAEKEYAQTLAILEEKKREVERLEERLAYLHKMLEEANRKQLNLQKEADICNRKLMKALKLMSGFESEKERWTLQAQNLDERLAFLPGDILLSSAITCYLSPLRELFRNKTIATWHQNIRDLNIPTSPDFNMVKLLGNTEIIQIWLQNDLMNNQFYIENAILFTISLKYTLFIDPQSQARNWIMSMEQRNNLQKVKMSDCYFLNVVKKCLLLGLPLLIENICNDLDDILDPLLNKEYVLEDGVKYLCLDGDILKCHSHFRLYLTSNLINPSFTPEVYNKVRLINFFVSENILQDVLLNLIIQIEKSDVKRQKENYNRIKHNNIQLLKSFDDKTLKVLSGTEANLLDDENSFRILEKNKIELKKILLTQDSCQELIKKVAELETVYLNVAYRSSIIYYCILDLVDINFLYHFSLEWFLNVFKDSIKSAPASRVLQQRINNLFETFMLNVTTTVKRGIFEKDRILFMFNICRKLNPDIKENPFSFFAACPTNFNIPQNKSFLNKKAWEQVCLLDEIDEFKGMLDSIVNQKNAWSPLCDANNMEHLSLPSPWNKLSNFSQLVVKQIFRPDRIIALTNTFIGQEIGTAYAESIKFDLNVLYKESYCLSPIVIFSTPQNNSLDIIKRFARSKRFTNKLRVLSLGAQDTSMVEEVLSLAQHEGLWICLDNCHLSPKWMLRLANIFEAMDFDDVHENFRLFILSNFYPGFPFFFLNNGIKQTYEESCSVKQNLWRLYEDSPISDPDFFESCPGNDKLFSNLVFQLTYFHALLSARQTIHTKWEQPYAFHDIDHQVSIQQLKFILNEYKNPLEAVKYVVGECNYSAQALNEPEGEMVKAYFQKIINYFNNFPSKTDYQNHLDHIAKINDEDVFDDDNLIYLHKQTNANHFYNVMRPTSISITPFDPATLLQDAKTLIEDSVLNLELSDPNDILMSVVQKEIRRYQKLLVVLKEVLLIAERHALGLDNVTYEKSSIIEYLSLNKVPEVLLRNSFSFSGSFLQFVSNLSKRLKYFKQWAQGELPKVFYLNYFFKPKRFLAAVSIWHCRNSNVLINNVRPYDFELCPENGIQMSGLQLFNAKFNQETNSLGAADPKIIQSQLPILCLRPRIGPSDKTYSCPMYKCKEFLCTIDFRIAENIQYFKTCKTFILCHDDLLLE